MYMPEQWLGKFNVLWKPPSFSTTDRARQHEEYNPVVLKYSVRAVNKSDTGGRLS